MFPTKEQETHSEMGEDEKNKLSDRGKRTKEMINWIKENEEIFK